MKVHISLAASAALLALVPVNTTLAAPAKGAATEVPSQLPRNAAPLHYSITVTPNAEKLSFEGNVLIEFLLKNPSDSVTLNAADIDFRRVTIAKGRAACHHHSQCSGTNRDHRLRQEAPCRSLYAEHRLFRQDPATGKWPVRIGL
jgi:hypothetical protein